MTGLLHEKEFSRKTFVKGGGALVVGFSPRRRRRSPARRSAAVSRPAAGYLPDLNAVDSWHRDQRRQHGDAQARDGSSSATGITTGVLM